MSVDEYVEAAAPVILIIFRTGKAAMIILIGWARDSIIYRRSVSQSVRPFLTGNENENENSNPLLIFPVFIYRSLPEMETGTKTFVWRAEQQPC